MISLQYYRIDVDFPSFHNFLGWQYPLQFHFLEIIISKTKHSYKNELRSQLPYLNSFNTRPLLANISQIVTQKNLSISQRVMQTTNSFVSAALRYKNIQDLQNRILCKRKHIEPSSIPRTNGGTAPLITVELFFLGKTPSLWVLIIFVKKENGQKNYITGTRISTEASNRKLTASGPAKWVSKKRKSKQNRNLTESPTRAKMCSKLKSYLSENS